MPNPKPRGKGILESPAIARLLVPRVVRYPETVLDRIHYGADSIDGWSPVLIAVNPAYMTAKRRKKILSDFNRLLTILIHEYAVLYTRRDQNDAVVRKYYDMKATGKQPTAKVIARSLGMKHDEVRTIVRRIRGIRKAK